MIDQAGHALFDGAGAQHALLTAAVVGADHRFERGKLSLDPADAIDRLAVEFAALDMLTGQHLVRHAFCSYTYTPIGILSRRMDQCQDTG